jgi:hypothetical protein
VTALKIGGVLSISLKWKVSHHWPPNNRGCLNNRGFRSSFYGLTLRFVGISKGHIGDCVRCDGHTDNGGQRRCYCLRVQFDTCFKGGEILIRPLPKHCLQGGGNILRPGWLPYFGKSRAFAPGAFYFCACLSWISVFHEIHLLK